MMEYVQQVAELNYLINLLKEAKIQTIGQNALNARAKMTDKDNLLHNLAEAIQVNVAPNFADVQIESEGDEWIGVESPSGGSTNSADSNVEYSSGKVPSGFTLEKAKAIKATAERLGIDPDDLAAVISFETGGTFSTTAYNKGSRATGLIQFIPSTAKGLGTTVEALAKMSFDQQMVFVEKYFKNAGFRIGKHKTLGDIYTAVTGCDEKKYGKGVCYRDTGNKKDAYNSNKIWDADGNGVIEKGEQVKSDKFKKHRKEYMKQMGLK